MSNAVGCFQLGNLAHDIVQGIVQLFVAVWNAVNFSMSMREAALLTLYDFEESSREGSESAEAVAREVIFSVKGCRSRR